MKDPDPAYEKKVLLDVVEQMDDPDSTGRKQTALTRIILGIGGVGLLVAFFLGINDLADSIIVAFVAGMSGAAIGFGLYLRFAQKQWPITTKHIDMDSVRSRLNELDI
jgi:hypothetical protein